MMKILITQNILLEGLIKVQNAVSVKNDREILKNILFKVEDNKLTLAATNQEIYISTELILENSTDGITTIPARKLLPIIKELPDEIITIEANDNNEMITIKCNKIDFNIQGLSAEYFPNLENIEDCRSFSFKASRFKRMIDSVSYAMGLDKTRPIICGLLFSIREQTVTIVATDGKRLSIIENAIENNANLDGDSVIPAKSINELQKLLLTDEDIAISLGISYATFKIGSTVLKTNLIEGKYPNYRGAIPDNFLYNVKVDRNIIIKAIYRASLILENSANSVKLDIKKSYIDVNASLNADISNELIAAESNSEEDIIISLNPTFIIQALKSQSKDELIIKFTAKDKSVGIIGDEGFLGIIMPMRN